ncbi:hypothetical protein E4T56_gene7673 [Termitomyces sp. T112]|nr:hypothetical protein E4T56_gene7673 [Termitomyces sp. T112]
MFAASLSHLTTHITSTTVPTSESQRSGTTPNKFKYVPPTPEPEVSKFGKGHEILHFLSHTQVLLEQGTSTGSFSAIVHKKVMKLPMTMTSSYLDVYAKVSETPKKSSKPEPVMSPGILIEHGELPSEGAKKAGVELEKKERQGEMKGGEEREKQPVVKAEEEKKKHATMAKAPTKQEASVSKSKSVFCNPLLRSKSVQKQDKSADSEAHKEKSVTLSFCLLPELPFFQSTSTPLATTLIPEKKVVPADAMVWDAEIKSPVQTSPRSLCSQPQDSISVLLEMLEDWSVIPTLAENGGEIENKNGLFNGPGIGWPVLSPKKSSDTSKTLTVSSASDANSVYEAIDCLAKSKVGKSVASLISPLDSMSFTLDIPIIQENNQLLPSLPELVSPRWSASLYVPSISQFLPIFSAHPMSSFYTSIPQILENYMSSCALDSVGKNKLVSPDFTSPTGLLQQSIDVKYQLSG